MARRPGNGRKFVWARTAGVIGLDAPAVGNGGADLLESVRGRYSDGIFVGATVMTVKGYLKPAGDLTAALRGRLAIRVCNRADTGIGTAIPAAEQGPGDGINPIEYGPESDWMGFFPFYLAGGRAADTATWNVNANQYAIDVQAPRRMEELGQTVGLFADVVDATEGARVDYDLSVGLKLA